MLEIARHFFIRLNVGETENEFFGITDQNIGNVRYFFK